jgi:hypothetical protein
LAVADAAVPSVGSSGGPTVPSPAGASVGTSGLFRGYRRAVFSAAGLGVVAIVTLSVLGHPVAGVLVAAGLAAGAWNAWRVQQSAPKVLAGGVLNKRSMTGSGVRRLGYLTLLTIGCAVALPPDGWTIALGLAAFQLVLIVNLVGPLAQEVRRG